jgi:hypothetical protein
VDLVRELINTLIQPPPVDGEAFDDASHLWRQDVGWCGQDFGKFRAQETLPLPNGNAALQEKGPDLIDDAGALADRPLAYPRLAGARPDHPISGRAGNAEVIPVITRRYAFEITGLVATSLYFAGLLY